MDPLVSVVTPAFNAARTLRRAHESVTRQTGRWQHIIVDDGSTDATSEMLIGLARDPRVVPIRTANNGQSAALNTGIDAAQGDFIAFLDADDEYLPGHLDSHLKAFADQPGVDLFWGGTEVVADDERDALVPDVARGCGLISVHDCVLQGTIFARRRVFENLRFTGDRTVWWQDYELVERVRREFTVARFYEPTYRYYRNLGASLIDRAKETWPTAAGFVKA